MRTHHSWAAAAVALVLTASLAQAGPPSLVNALLSTKHVAVSLDQEFKAAVNATTSATWIAWMVPASPSGRDTCCNESRSGVTWRCGCRLEDEHGLSTGSREDGKRTVQLESGGQLVVLVRAENRVVQRTRAYSADCGIDAGGRPVVWLEGVKPGESVALLAKLAQGAEPDAESGHRVQDGAIMALAMHADPAADQAIAALAAPATPDKLREQAIFWMGAARGAGGYQAVNRILRDDPSPRIRKQAVFALSISKVEDSTTRLLQVAREDESGEVRGQALFWLAQKAGKKVADAIAGAVRDDPNTEVKKRAVFALSQLPKEEGVQRLIDVARTNKNPEVRKQAMFWLGQSRDPRALSFIEEILTR